MTVIAVDSGRACIKCSKNRLGIVMNELNPATFETHSKISLAFTAVLVVTLVLLALYYRDQLTVDFIIHVVAEHPSIAALIFLALYLLKTLALVVPVIVLYVAAGLMFKPAVAIGLNTVGIWIGSTLPFLLGRYYGTSLVEKMYLRYPKLQQLVFLQNQNGSLFAFAVRIIGFIPVELASMFMGALGTPYRPYILGSMLGLFPTMVLYTFLGYTISDPTSPAFIIVLALTILSTVVTAVLYPIYLRKQYNSQHPTVSA